jgi:hypothetical protein
MSMSWSLDSLSDRFRDVVKAGRTGDGSVDRTAEDALDRLGRLDYG